MLLWDGPRSMSLESLTCVLLVTQWTPGWVTLLRLEMNAHGYVQGLYVFKIGLGNFKMQISGLGNVMDF